MIRDKYGANNDPYSYSGSTVLKNVLNIRDNQQLEHAEIKITSAAAETLEFHAPPYDYSYLKALHRHLFQNIYSWAGEERSTDISKGTTRFCTATRIAPEAKKAFTKLRNAQWFTNIPRDDLVIAIAEFYSDLNMLHPFREGNGRTLRVLFEHIIINTGYEIDWSSITQQTWLHANIAAVSCDYGRLEQVFNECIGR